MNNHDTSYWLTRRTALIGGSLTALSVAFPLHMHAKQNDVNKGDF